MTQVTSQPERGAADVPSTPQPERGAADVRSTPQPEPGAANVEGAPLENLRHVVARARGAQEYWRDETVAVRAEKLRRAAKGMLARRAEIVAITGEEIGKVAAEALFNEALGPLDQVSGWAAVVERAVARRRVRLNPLSFPGKEAWIDHLPRGVVGVIAPWNFPVAGLYRSVLPALLTGNAVVLKPSEHSPRSAAWFIERLAAELPDGLVTGAFGDGAVGVRLVDAGIDACVFTGSTRTGRLVAAQCVARSIPSSLEMGGKDAAIVLADCDLPRTVAGVTHWALSNAGQSCGAIEVAYVDTGIADRFVDAMARAWTKLDAFSVAPLAHAGQFAVVAAHVDDARRKGARVVCGGGPRGDANGYLPTLLDGCDERMAVVTDETFGPVLAIVRIDGAAEAVRAINGAPYGLGASIWSGDDARARRLAERLDVGVVNVNNHSFSGAIPALPWSGTRGTGFGVAGSDDALLTFVRPRALLVDRSSAPDVFWMPYDQGLLTLGDILADVQIGKVAAAWKLPLLLRQRVRTVREFFRASATKVGRR